MITIVDYGLGNLGSIQNMLRKLGHTSELTSDPVRVAEATAIVLPGVGAFDLGMRNLRELGLREALDHLALERKVPVLGICLGAQLMTRGSEEGEERGLGWVDADTVRFSGPALGDLPIPSMGWSTVRGGAPHFLFPSAETPRFYFVHSFHFRADAAADVIGWSTYGYEFAAAFARDHIVGVQFHPEKSHRFGMALFDRFARHVSEADR
jgi:glutamine amidotransferase